MTLRELRKAKSLMKGKLARSLKAKQKQVSRIEQRTDLHISTLRRTVETMGGELTIYATFPNGAPVKIVGLGDI
jgi:predicted transcriptional regulator